MSAAAGNALSAQAQAKAKAEAAARAVWASGKLETDEVRTAVAAAAHQTAEASVTRTLMMRRKWRLLHDRTRWIRRAHEGTMANVLWAKAAAAVDAMAMVEALRTRRRRLRSMLLRSTWRPG